MMVVKKTCLQAVVNCLVSEQFKYYNFNMSIKYWKHKFKFWEWKKKLEVMFEYIYLVSLVVLRQSLRLLVIQDDHHLTI